MTTRKVKENWIYSALVSDFPSTGKPVPFAFTSHTLKSDKASTVLAEITLPQKTARTQGIIWSDPCIGGGKWIMCLHGNEWS